MHISRMTCEQAAADMHWQHALLTPQVTHGILQQRGAQIQRSGLALLHARQEYRAFRGQAAMSCF